MTTPTTTLKATFVSESAAYENTFGWYNKVTGYGGILFADVESEGRHAPLDSGDSVNFTVNTADVGNIQFFLISDGYNQNDADDLARPIKVIKLSDGTWAVARVDAHGNVITDHGKPDILEGAGANALFTETSKNAGGVDYASSTTGTNQTAATLAGDTADGAIGQIAWEDLAATRNKNGTYTKPGDADYNDAVFRISVVSDNHAPVAVADRASVTEDAPPNPVAGNVLLNDTDPDAGDTHSVTAVNGAAANVGANVAGTYGTLHLNADGSFSYTLNNNSAAVQALQTGQHVDDVFTYTNGDNHGGSSSTTLTVTVNGANEVLPPVVSLSPAVVEGMEGAALQFTFTRTGGDLSQALTINYIVNDGPPLGGATRADGDFSYPSGIQQLTFAAGQTTATISVQTNDDAKVEGDETFPVLLAGGTNYTVDAAHSGSTAIIHDNDVAPPAVVSLSAAVVEGTEGAALQFTFTRTGGDLSQALTINYIVNDGPPLGGATRADGDFSYPSGIQQLTFAAGQTTATISVQTNDDAKVEGDESFPVQLAGGTNYTVDPAHSGATAVIHDNDVLPSVSVVATDGVGTETVDGTDFIFTFTRTGDTSQALTVNYGTLPAPVDGATPGLDFPAQSGTITFAAGSATAVLTFDAIHDAVVENTELFSVVVASGAGYLVDTPNATANGSIIDGTIIGTPLADNLIGTADPDAILGLGGDDGLSGGLGADFLDGGAGFDRAMYTNAGAAVNIQLAAGTATIGAVVDTLRSIEFARGTAFDDVYNAAGFGPASSPNASSEGNNLNGFEGLGGNDQIIGNGNTRIEYTNATAGVTVTLTTGNSGNVAGNTSVGTDTFSNVFSVRGSQFDDSFINTANTNNTFDGQGGFDTVSYLGATAGITANLATGNVSGGGGSDVLRDNLGNVTIEGIIGTGFNDTFVASGNNRFDGGFGADTLSTSGPNDVVTAISIETINGGTGNDTMTFVVNDGSVNQSVNLGGGTNVLNFGLGGTYSLSIAGSNLTVNGTAGNEDINLLNQQAGTIYDLGAGTDTLHLFNAAPFINDVTVANVENVIGSSAADTIRVTGNTNVTNATGAGGGDLLYAGTGVDHFVYTSLTDSTPDVGGGQRDLIRQFGDSQDVIDVRGLGIDAYSTEDFGGTTTVVHLYAAGDHINPAMDIALDGTHSLTAANFLFV